MKRIIKRTLSLILALSLMLSLAISGVYAEATDPRTIAMVGTITGTTLGTDNLPVIKFTVRASGGTFGSTNGILLEYDSSVIVPGNLKWNEDEEDLQSAAATSASQAVEGKASFSGSGSTMKTGAGGKTYFYLQLDYSGGSVDNVTNKLIGEVSFVFLSGKGAADLNSSSVQLVNDETQLDAEMNYRLLYDDGDGNSASFGSYNDSTKQYEPENDKLDASSFSITFPRSDVTGNGKPTLKADANTKISANEGVYTATTAPAKGEEYTTTAPLAVLIPENLGANETVTGISVKAADTTSTLGFAVENDGTNYVLTAPTVSKKEAASKVVLTVSVESTTPAYTYDADVELNIKTVTLPPKTLGASNSGTFVLGDGEDKSLSEAIAGAGLPVGWTVLNNTNKALVEGCSLTPKTSDELAAFVSAGDSIQVPVYFAEDENNAHSADTFTVNVVSGPSQNTITNLTQPEKIEAGLSSIKFKDATNPNWEYQLSATKHTEVTPSAALDTWVDGVAESSDGAGDGGVEFTGLSSGTDYYLNVRVKNDPTIVSYATTPVATLYDINVKSATKANGDSTLQGNGEVYVATADAVADQNALDAYKQTIVLENNNGNSVYNVSVTLTGVTPAGAFTIESTTYSDGSTAGELKPNGEITVVVAPSLASAQLGENTANVVITGYASDGTTKIVEKTIPIKLVVYGSRGGTKTGDDAVTILASDTAGTSLGLDKATANKEIALDIQWTPAGDGATALKPDSYAVSDTTNYEITGDAENGYKLKVKNDRPLTAIGETVTVTATFNRSVEGSGSYYILETVPKVFTVKGTAADIVTGDIDILIGSGSNTADLTYSISGITAAVNGSETAGTSIDGNYLVTVASNATPGVTTYTVTVPNGMANYTPSSADVKVYALQQIADFEVSPAIELTAGTTGQTSEITLVASDGTTTYTVDTYKLDGTEITVTDNKYDMPIDVPGKYTVTMHVPADKTNTYSSEFTATQYVYVRAAVVWSGDDSYVLNADAETPETSGTINLTTGKNNEALSYTIVDGATIIALTDGGPGFTVLDDAKGIAQVKVTSAQLDDQLADSKIVTIEVKRDADGSGDPDDGTPVHGTGANITGQIGSDFVRFNTKADGSSVNLSDENDIGDHWGGVGATTVKFSNLTPGVAYQYRVSLVSDPTNWLVSNDPEGTPPYASDADGWREITTANTSVEVTWTPMTGNIYTAEIRYKDDGTIGDTVVNTDPVDFTIHNLTKGVKYEFRVVTGEDAYDTTITGADTEGWAPIPAYDAENANTVEQSDTALYMYKHAYVDGEGNAKSYVKVETRYANDPEITKDPETGDYIISGLIPGAKYDLQSLTIAKETGFLDDENGDPSNYLQKDASLAANAETGDAAGTIRLVKDSAEYTTLEVATNNGVRIRQSATEGSNPSDPDEPMAGVTVSGKISSYNPRGIATISLYVYNGEDDIAALTRDGRNLKETPYTTTVGDPEAGTTNQAVINEFTIEGVPEGTYVLAVKKAGFLIYTIKGIVVGSENVDLKLHSNTKVSTITLLAGDILDDGSIDGKDSGLMFAKATWTKKISAGANSLADLTGDGTVDGQDSGKMFNKASWLAKDTGKYILNVDLTPVEP